MRILQVGNAQMRRFGKARVSTEQKLYNGFIRNNHHLLHFSDRDMASFLAPFGLRDLGIGKMNRRLIETASNFQPGLILLGHCDLIANETLDEIRKLVPDLRIAYRNVDPLFVPHNIDAIHRRTASVDAIFITTAGPGVDQFRGKRASIHYIPNPTDPSIETLDNSIHDDLPYDLFFCGNSDEHTERTQTVKFLKKELDGKLAFRTPGYFGEPNVWGRDYDDLLAQCKMGLNLNRQEDFLYSSARLAQLMGNGILAFTHKRSQLETLFESDTLCFFDNDDDLKARILYFQRNETERKRIASRGRRFYREHFDCTHVAAFILEQTCGLPPSRQFVWASI